jgi:hypothetical protein
MRCKLGMRVTGVVHVWSGVGSARERDDFERLKQLGARVESRRR